MSNKIVRKIITTKSAPIIAPFSQAVQVGNTLYVSGQIGYDPVTMDYVEGGVEPQCRQVLKNMGAILKEAGCTFNNVFGSAAPPARAAYQVAELPFKARVEIEAVAMVGQIVDEN